MQKRHKIIKMSKSCYLMTDTIELLMLLISNFMLHSCYLQVIIFNNFTYSKMYLDHATYTQISP